MQIKLSTIIWTLLWSLFMGVTAISIGVGAIFPPLNYIAAPLVCPGGQMSVNSTVYNPYPGTTVTTEDWICTNNRTGAQTDLSVFRIAMVAGLLYGFVLFVVILIGMWLIPIVRSNRSPAGATKAFEPGHGADMERAAAADDPELAQLLDLERKERGAGGSGGNAISDRTSRRLKELENLRTSNLISQAEYDRKRSEILSSL